MKRHYPHLDGVRALAILLVLASHLLGFDAATSGFLICGELGVLIFFVLSGFLITDLLCQERARTGTISIRRFFIRRALRIFPAYYFFLAVVALLGALGAVDGGTPLVLAECALYLRNIFGRGAIVLTHTWSLALEEQFYAVWPWLFALVSRRRLLPVVLAIVAAIAAFRTSAIAWHLADGQFGQFYMRPWFRFDSPLAGCCVALWIAARSPTAKAPRLLALAHPIVTVPSLFLVARYADRLPHGDAVALTVEVALAAAALAWLMLAPAASIVTRILSLAPLRAIGRISYSLYLWQQLFLTAKSPCWGPLRRFPVDVAAAFAAALLSYFIIERPFLRLKARFS